MPKEMTFISMTIFQTEKPTIWTAEDGFIKTEKFQLLDLTPTIPPYFKLHLQQMKSLDQVPK